jgi:hypothetical protein
MESDGKPPHSKALAALPPLVYNRGRLTDRGW